MKVIIICGILYLLWVAIYLLLSRQSTKQKTVEQSIVLPSKMENIMGGTKSVSSQITPSEAKQSHGEDAVKQSVTFASESPKTHSAVVAKEELDELFSNDKMEIDVEADYLENGESELEGIACYMGSPVEHITSQSGVGFEEMDNLAKVVAEKEKRIERITAAVATAKKVEDTALFDAVVSGYENGLQKVAAMFAKYEPTQPIRLPNVERYEEFELKNFL